MTISGNYEGPCTADLAPYGVVVEVPEDIDLSRAVRLVVVEDGEKDLRFNL